MMQQRKTFAGLQVKDQVRDWQNDHFTCIGSKGAEFRFRAHRHEVRAFLRCKLMPSSGCDSSVGEGHGRYMVDLARDGTSVPQFAHTHRPTTATSKRSGLTVAGSADPPVLLPLMMPTDSLLGDS
jgi:hypothetical protein